MRNIGLTTIGLLFVPNCIDWELSKKLEHLNIIVLNSLSSLKLSRMAKLSLMEVIETRLHGDRLDIPYRNLLICYRFNELGLHMGLLQADTLKLITICRLSSLEICDRIGISEKIKSLQKLLLTQSVECDNIDSDN